MIEGNNNDTWMGLKYPLYCMFNSFLKKEESMQRVASSYVHLRYIFIIFSLSPD